MFKYLYHVVVDTRNSRLSVSTLGVGPYFFFNNTYYKIIFTRTNNNDKSQLIDIIV